MISGVCNGLAKWLDVNVTILRIVAVVLAFATGGGAVFGYLLLMVVLPYDDDRGAARGLPRTARSLVERLRGQTA
jgi:phage shock protein PspC (stress-responsive transcriptional regulator)